MIPVTRKPTSLRVRCAMCNKPVDRVVWGEDFHTGTVWVKVECHGQVDRMEITEAQMARMSTEQIRGLRESEGVAFETRRLPA